MIIWINGTFGVGKTTTAKKLVELVPEAKVFNSERIGGFLTEFLNDQFPVENFQDWPAWRVVTGEVVAQLGGSLKAPVVVPQTVLTREYWCEIRDRMNQSQVEYRHFVLYAGRATLEERIENDGAEPQAREWRLDHCDRWEAAMGWLKDEATVIDTDGVNSEEVARRILDGR
ncbi:AAA family ATPase [Haloglycomyces albus]|uniref:AAA family ATPase n=1 Tax=Haloglycomyces albus TaxID=526067 RepID=UPI00046D3AE9|nr:AAA family ATPase [Haloglycomyces albus]